MNLSDSFPWMLAILLKPILLLALFTPGAFIRALVSDYFPAGSIKRFLLISWNV